MGTSVSDFIARISKTNLRIKKALSAASVKARVSAANVDLTTRFTLLELQETGQD